MGPAYYLTGQYAEAVAPLQEVLASNPVAELGLNAHLYLAASYSELGQAEEAQAEVAEVLKINPNFSLHVWTQRVPYQDPAATERIAAALRRAGLK